MKDKYIHMKLHLRMLGYFIPALSIILLIVFGVLLYKVGDTETYILLNKLIEIIVPLSFGLQASSLIAEEIDNKMEIPVVTQTSLSKLFFSRYILCFILWLLIGSVGNAIILSVTKNPMVQLFTWIPTAIIISAVACFTSVLSKQSVFGALLALLFWGGMLIGGDSLVSISPIFTFIHIYLSHQSVTPGGYILNRMIVLSLGLFLLYFVRLLLQNEERFFV